MITHLITDAFIETVYSYRIWIRQENMDIIFSKHSVTSNSENAEASEF